MYTINMTHNKNKGCYISPLFTSGKWICGGEWGTGETTQDYEKPNIKKIITKEREKTLNLTTYIFFNIFFYII